MEEQKLNGANDAANYAAQMHQKLGVCGVGTEVVNDAYRVDFVAKEDPTVKHPVGHETCRLVLVTVLPPQIRIRGYRDIILRSGCVLTTPLST